VQISRAIPFIKPEWT